MMRKVKVLVTLLIAIVTSMNIANAQTTFHIGGVLPIGDFGDDYENSFFLFDDDGETAAAATGFTLGLKFQKSLIAVDGLSLFGSIDAMWNGLKGDLKRRI